jgi:hypothetical protein
MLQSWQDLYVFVTVYFFSTHAKKRKTLNISVSRSSLITRVVYLCAKHPLNPWTDPLEICKMSTTNTEKQPAKYLRHPTATKFCFCWSTTVGNNSFSKIYMHARWFVQCYREHFVIKLLYSWQRYVLRLWIYNVHTKCTYSIALYNKRGSI